MDIEVKVGIRANDDLYTMNLKIPTTDIDKENPFKFDATVKSGENDPDTILRVVYGDSSYYLVAVQPPKSILSGLGELVDSLQVLVKEGDVPLNLPNTERLEPPESSESAL